MVITVVLSFQTSATAVVHTCILKYSRVCMVNLRRKRYRMGGVMCYKVSGRNVKQGPV